MEIIENLNDYTLEIKIRSFTKVQQTLEKIILDKKSNFRIVFKFEGILIPYEHFGRPFFATKFYFKEENKDIALKFKLTFS